MECRADIAELMSKCIECNLCVEVCTSRAYGGCNPMEVMKGNFEYAKGCLGCGLCNTVCDTTVPKKVMMYAVCKTGNLEPPKVYIDTGYNLPQSEMKDIPDPGYTENAEAVLMPGCMVNAFAPFLEYGAAKALEITGVKTERYEGGCCTYPVVFRGMTDEERDSVKKEKASQLKGRKLYALCSGCSDEMVASGIDSEHVYKRLHEHLDDIKKLPGVKLRVAVNPGCGLLKRLPEFRDIVKACGCEILDIKQGCCGKAIPGLSERIMADRQRDLKGADAVVVGCPACFARYDGYEGGVPVIHISELVCLASGDLTTLKYHGNKLDPDLF